MPPRLGFTKSRAGCQRCKQRRVKCDEKRPCSACTRHGTVCTYEPAGRRPTTRARANEASHSPPNSLQGAQTHSSLQLRHRTKPSPVTLAFAETPFISASTAHQQPIKPAQGLTRETWEMDLMLMHHYSTSTYATLPRGEKIGDIWQREIPNLAVGGYRFLTQQLLATAAYHLAYLHPGQSRLYALQALRHQNDSIVNLQRSLPNLRADNCDAFFAASSLLTMSAFASAGSDASDNTGIEGILDTFGLIRGMSEILKSYELTLKGGRLGHLFRVGFVGEGCPVLRQIIAHLEGFIVPQEIDPQDAELCRNTISASIEWLKLRGSVMRTSLSWPICLGDDFISLLRRRHSVAIAILSYYAVALHTAGTETWYFEHWGQRILKDISQSIDPRFKHLAEWPLAQINIM